MAIIFILHSRIEIKYRGYNRLLMPGRAINAWKNLFGANYITLMDLKS